MPPEPVPYHMRLILGQHPLLPAGLAVLGPRPAPGPAAFTEPGDRLPHGAAALPAPPEGEFSAPASGLRAASEHHLPASPALLRVPRERHSQPVYSGHFPRRIRTWSAVAPSLLMVHEVTSTRDPCYG